MEDEGETSDNSLVVPNLDDDVLLDILSFVPVKPLVQYKTVSKHFLSLIRNPIFINLHLSKNFMKKPEDRILIFEKLQQSSSSKLALDCKFDSATKTLIQERWVEFPYKEGRLGMFCLVGSSNGLMCFSNSKYVPNQGFPFVWNPVFKKIKVVPNFLSEDVIFSSVVFGFAFVSEINDFKLVQIAYDSPKSDADVSVYTMGGNCWRKIDALVPCHIPSYWSENVFIKGSIHWMAFKGSISLRHRDRIMSFDMRNEVFGEFRLPINMGPGHLGLKLLASCSGDSLSLFVGSCNRWEVWSMRQYGVVESWEMQYIINNPSREWAYSVSKLSLPLRFMDNGHILAVRDWNLTFLNPETQAFKETGICFQSSPFLVVGYTESLGLLDNEY